MMGPTDSKIDLHTVAEKNDVDPTTVEKNVVLGEVHDIGANLYVEAEQLSSEEVEREGAQILRILDWRLMPIVGRIVPSD